MYTKLLTKIQRKLELLIGSTEFDASYIGNDLYHNFFNDFEFSSHLENFFSASLTEGVNAVDTLIIVGAVNLNQIKKIEKMYEQLVGPYKMVIHLQGAINPHLKGRSYFICQNLNDYIPVNLSYKKYPFNLKEISEQVIEMRTKLYES